MRLHHQATWVAMTLVAIVSMVTVYGDDSAEKSVELQQLKSTWNEPVEDRLNLCGSDPASVATCALCPRVIGKAVSAWSCCHDTRTFEICAAAVAGAIENKEEEKLEQLQQETTDNDLEEEKRAKYFLGKRAKYFLGKRSFGPYRGGYYDWSPALRHQVLNLDYGLRGHENGGVEKRAKYFLGR